MNSGLTRWKRAAFALFIAGIAATAACSSSAPPPARTAALARSDVFQAHSVAPTDKTAVIRATSLLGSQTIDTAVLAQLITQRLSAVEADALRDTLKGIDTSSEPMEDLLNAVAGLIVSTSDGQTKSQALVAALVRDGLSFTVAALGRAGAVATNGCPQSELDTAGYEGLAQSTLLHSLGFPLATGHVVAECTQFANSVALMADGSATLPASEATKTLSASISTVGQKCTAGAAETPAIAATVSSMASLDTVKIIDLRKAAASSSDAASGRQDVCSKALNDFVSAYDAAFGKLGGRLDNKATVGEVGKAKERLQAFTTPASGAPTPSDSGASTSSDSGAPTLLACVGDAGTPPNTSVLLSEITTIVTALVNQTPLTRGDIISLTATVQSFIDCVVPNGVAKDVLDVFLESIPDAIKEDSTSSAGIDMDVPALVTGMVARFDATYNAGWYLRATIGAGYIYERTVASGERDWAPSYYEEIGFGRRCYGTGGLLSWSDPAHCRPSQKQAILHGFQVVSSGLLFQISSVNEVKNNFFVGGGYSVNFYRLLDLSVNAGEMFDLQQSSNNRFAILAGLQLPIFDYLSALTNSTSVDSQTKSSK